MPAVDTLIPLYFGADPLDTVTVNNYGNVDVYYQSATNGGQTISSSVNDGTVTAGTSADFNVPTFLLGASAGAIVDLSKAPTAKTAAYTRTYNTSARTVPNATYAAPSVTYSAPTTTAVAVATTGSTSTTPFGYAQAQADAIVTNLNAAVADIAAVKAKLAAVATDAAAAKASLAALAADLLALKKLDVAIVSDLETAQIAG